MVLVGDGVVGDLTWSVSGAQAAQLYGDDGNLIGEQIG
jgi:hypothetical protein